MDNSPLSQQFLQVEHDSIIAGTIPRDTETRPHVQISYDDTALIGQSNTDNKPIGIIGPATDGRPDHVYTINSMHQAKQIFGSGDLVNAIRLAWNPQSNAYGNGGTIYAERVQNANQASLDPGALHFISTIYGNKANNISVKLSQDPLTSTWTVDVKDRNDGYHANYNGIGLLALINYKPNAWDKYHIPAGQKDYSRASLEILPNIKTDEAGNLIKKSVTGEAAKMVFHIHDTKNAGILHNNITNNIGDRGSTIYEPNYTEKETSDNAAQGDLNPNRGPFEDWTFTVDLTDPKFHNLTDLFSYLQNTLNLDLQLVDGHHISHIAPTMLDLTRRPINLINETNKDTLDENIKPAGLWSTLGDLVDKLRYDTHVHARADMKYQLNYISTIPSGAANYAKQVSSYANLASTASSYATYNSEQASGAFAGNVPRLGSQYQSVADSYTSLKAAYGNLEKEAGVNEMSAANRDVGHVTSADQSASAVINSVNANATQVNNDLDSLRGIGTRKNANFANNNISAEYSNYASLTSKADDADNSLANHDVTARQTIDAKAQAHGQDVLVNNSVEASMDNSLNASEAYVRDSISALRSSASSYYQDYLAGTYVDYSGGVLNSLDSQRSKAAESANSIADSMASSVSSAESSLNSTATPKEDKLFNSASSASAKSNSAAYKSFMDKEQSVANHFSSLVSSAANNTSVQSAKSSIATFNYAANSYAQKHSSAVNSLAVLKNKLSADSSLASSAESAAAKADRDSLSDGNESYYGNTGEKLQTYVNNLLQDINNATQHNAYNVVESDLDELSNIAQKLGEPETTMSSQMYRVGLKMQKDLDNALEAYGRARENMNGAQDDFQINLGKAVNDVNKLEKNSPVPRGIFTLEIGGGQINVLGEPIQAFDYTNLTGGYTSKVPVDWSNKFHVFDDYPVYDMVVLSPHESVHATLAAYISDRFYANHNMRGFVGGGYNENVQELLNRSSDLDSERMCLVGTSGYYSTEDGLNLHLPAYETAAIIAGIDSSLPVGESILNKPIDFNKVDQHFSSTALDNLDQGGVITANPVINRGISSTFTISDDVTTSKNHQNPVQSELSLGEVTDFLFDDLREYLHRYIGDSVTASSASELADAVNTFLHEKTSDANTENLLVAYKPEDTFCEIHNQSAYFRFVCAPTLTLKYIKGIGTYDGLDEQSGGNGSNVVPFEFIDASGTPQAADTDMGNGADNGSDDQSVQEANNTED